MSIRRRDRLSRLGGQLESIVERAEDFESRYGAQLALLHPSQSRSGRNLLHYLALRQSDVRELQDELSHLGLSSLGRSEAHVLASVHAVLHAVRQLSGLDSRPTRPPVTFRQGREQIRAHTTALLGKKLKGSSIRIMVTLPDEAADDYGLVLDLVKAGMNCARINCAHRGPDEWERMVSHVHRARTATGRACKVFMDLCGPKIRIGSIVPGPRVLKISPQTDVRGRVPVPEVVHLVPDDGPPGGTKGVRLPLPRSVHDRLLVGQRLELTDTRGLPGTLTVVAREGSAFRALCSSEVYLETGLPVALRDDRGRVAAEGAVGQLPEARPQIVLRIGDILVVHRDPRPGEPAREAPDGGVSEPAHVPCAIPEVLDRARVGQPLVLDDGKIRGVIQEVLPDGVAVQITHADPDGTKLKAFKGLNLPETELGIFGLTDADREDLRFVVRHADGVNVSFVNHPDDVEDLLDELEAQGGDELGLILKIETRMGVKNLPGILLAAMEWPAVGVMIARGDLAVEVGWTHLARVQEEILWVCESAHVPVVWATQVLDRLAKKGLPTRGEISDVVMAERAECVMLNKGPYITRAIRALDSILASMQSYQRKKTTLLPALTLEAPDPEEVGRPIGTREGRWTLS